MDWDVDHNKICASETGTPIVPRVHFPATTCLLYHNRGDGTFEDVSEAFRESPPRKGVLLVSPAFADYDGERFHRYFCFQRRTCSNIIFSTTTVTALSRSAPWNQAWD